MEYFARVIPGAMSAIEPRNILFCLTGVLLGTLVAGRSGSSALTLLAIVLAVSVFLPAGGSLVMAAAICYGAQHGRAATAILNADGSTAPEARTGAMLSLAALSSFVVGTVAIFVLIVTVPFLSRILSPMPLWFGPAEWFLLLLIMLVASVTMTGWSLLKGAAMAVLGLLVGLTGMDVNSGTLRFIFGRTELLGGLPFLAVMVGLFGFSGLAMIRDEPQQKQVPVGGIWPTPGEVVRSIRAMLRGGGSGMLAGVLPLGMKFGGNAVGGATEDAVARGGFGAAAAHGAFIPFLAFGLATAPVMLLVATASLGGDTPDQNPDASIDLFWLLCASMLVGNLILLILTPALTAIRPRLPDATGRLFVPLGLVMCCIGVYRVTESVFDVGIAALFGVVGFVLRALGCHPAPLMVGMILGALMEEHFRRAAIRSRGDLTIFFQNPLDIMLLLFAAALVLATLLPAVRRMRNA